LRQEFRELELLDEITELRFNRKLPAGVGGTARNYLISSYRKAKGVLYVPKAMPCSLQWSNDDEYVIEDPFEEAAWEIIDRKKKAQESRDAARTSKDDSSKSEARSQHKRTDPQRFVVAKGTSKLAATSTVQGERLTKKRKTATNHNTALVERLIWNSNTYSCAFDSLFTILLQVMNNGTENWNELM
ncbi:hypothetical protein BC629DRAFT_1273090, partial [Irpex lacteus]